MGILLKLLNLPDNNLDFDKIPLNFRGIFGNVTVSLILFLQEAFQVS